MYTRQEIKQRAKEQIRGKIFKFFLSNLVAVLTYIVPVMAVVMFCVTANVGRGILSVLILAAIFFTMGPVMMGAFSYLYLKNARSGDFEIGDVFYGYKTCWVKSTGLLFFQMLFIYLWSMLLCIPGIIKSYSYALCFFVLADNPDMSPIDAITESRRLMDGHKLELFVLYLSFILWIILIYVTLGLASFYVLPYMYQSIANFYESVKGNGNSVSNSGTQAWEM